MRTIKSHPELSSNLQKMEMVYSASKAAFLNGFEHMTLGISEYHADICIFCHTTEELELATRLLNRFAQDGAFMERTDLSDSDGELYTVKLDYSLNHMDD